MGTGSSADTGAGLVQVVVRPAAAADIEDAYQWYERQRAGLGEEFLELVNRTMLAIQGQPARFPVIHRDTRRAFLRRFPYGVFYVTQADTIVVVACMHARRDPRMWRSRG